MTERSIFDQKVYDYEASLIAGALITHQMSITAAAKELGITHQRLSSILLGRHAKLREALNIPVQDRKKSIVRNKHSRKKST